MPAKRKTELAVVGGAGLLTAYEPASHRFTEGATRHHRQFFRDYEVAKQHIVQALGDLAGFEIFGDNVLCAVFCRPKVTPGGIIVPDREVKEDWWQQKAVLIVKMGPSAFEGDDSYLEAKFGRGKVPAVGDWMMANANAGIQCSIMGPGGTRPEGVVFEDYRFDLYSGDGWPCRLIKDADFYMRIREPHGVV